MAKVILDIADSNMAGDVWSSQYLLEVNPDGGFKLRSQQDVFHSEDSEEYVEEIAEMLEPFRRAIKKHLHTVKDHKFRYGPSHRWLVKRFIEDFVMANGCLPTGEHAIGVQMGSSSCSGGTHDFGELGKPTRDQ